MCPPPSSLKSALCNFFKKETPLPGEEHYLLLVRTDFYLGPGFQGGPMPTGSSEGKRRKRYPRHTGRGWFRRKTVESSGKERAAGPQTQPLSTGNPTLPSTSLSSGRAQEVTERPSFWVLSGWAGLTLRCLPVLPGTIKVNYSFADWAALCRAPTLC